MSWNSEQYLKFKTERTQPAIDLANRITAQSPRDIIDIGCGPGNSTEILKKRYPNAAVAGADNSENMLETARKNHADIEFILCDASRDLCRLGRKFDVVFFKRVHSMGTRPPQTFAGNAVPAERWRNTGSTDTHEL